MTTLAHERGTGFAFKEQVLQEIARRGARAAGKAHGVDRTGGARGDRPL
jgi:hypothetical protein